MPSKINPGSKVLIEFPGRSVPPSPGHARDVQLQPRAAMLQEGGTGPVALSSRFILCTNPYAVAAGASAVFLPTFSIACSNISWTGIRSVNPLTGAAGPSFSLPDPNGNNTLLPIQLGASSRYPYLMAVYIPGLFPNGVDRDAPRSLTWFRTPIDGSGPWVIYATSEGGYPTDAGTSLVPGSWGYVPYRSGGYSNYQTDIYSSLPLANCGIEPLTDTLWVPVVIPFVSNQEPSQFFLVRKRNDQPADLVLPVGALEDGDLPIAAPFWVFGPQGFAPDGQGEQWSWVAPTSIIYLADPPITLPLPVMPAGEEAWYSDSTLLTVLKADRFLLLKASNLDPTQVLSWIYAGGAWAQGTTAPGQPATEGDISNVYLGAGPDGEPWNLVSRAFLAKFLLGQDFDGSSVAPEFGLSQGHPTYGGWPLLSADFPGFPGVLSTDPSYLTMNGGWWIPPLKLLPDGALLLTGFDMPDPRTPPGLQLWVSEDGVDAMQSDAVYGVDPMTGPCSVNPDFSLTPLTTTGVPEAALGAWANAVLAVGPTGLFALNQGDTSNFVVLRYAPEGWTLQLDLDGFLAAQPELAGLVDPGPGQLLADGAGGLWLTVYLRSPDWSSRTGLILYCPPGGAWAISKTFPDSYGPNRLSFAGAKKSFLSYLDDSSTTQVWDGSGWFAIPLAPAGNGTAMPWVISPTEAWAYIIDYPDYQPYFYRYTGGAWQPGIRLDAGMGFTGDSTLWPTSRGALLFSRYTFGGYNGVLFVPGATPALYPVLRPATAHDPALITGDPVRYIGVTPPFYGNSAVWNLIETSDGVFIAYTYSGGYGT